MIKNVYGNSTWVNVSGSGSQMPYVNTSQPIAGMLRMNSGMNRLEVYDGSSWLSFGNDVHVDLSERAKQILAWAEEKMCEDQRLQDLLAKHPGLKELHDKFKMMEALCQQEETKE